MKHRKKNFWKNDLNHDIPRKEMLRIEKIIGNYNINWIIAKSFRICKKFSGNVDLIIEKTNGITMYKILKILEPVIADYFSKGEIKLIGIFKENDDNYEHKIDIVLSESKSLSFAILYFTGSKNLI